jgi:hypothetical protein
MMNTKFLSYFECALWKVKVKKKESEVKKVDKLKKRVRNIA